VETKIVDEIEARCAEGAPDGFNLMFPVLLPDHVRNSVELVAPEL
jgi:hypothetical protein